MKVLQIGTLLGVNFFLFQVNVLQGEPDWIVNEKVSGFGENLTLFCLIDDCCTKEAGWVKFDPDYETIFLDVRNSKNYTSTDKYAATTNSTGFSLTINSIQKEDINIRYSCLYGFDQSRTKVLNQLDAFRDNGTRSELPVTEIIIGSLILLVAVVVFTLILKRINSRRRSCEESSQRDRGVHVALCKEMDEVIVKDGEITEPVSKSHEQSNDKREILFKENDERKELVSRTTILTDCKPDIVIIHTEEEDRMMQGVKSYKCHLEHLSAKMGYSNIIIKLFEDVFTHEEMSSYVEIQTVLAKCRYVFVYISPNFMESKLKKFGMKECWIRDALKTPETYRRIKIVSNCASWELPNDRYLSIKKNTVDFDYFQYVQDCQDDIEKYQNDLQDVLQDLRV